MHPYISVFATTCKPADKIVQAVSFGPTRAAEVSGGLIVGLSRSGKLLAIQTERVSIGLAAHRKTITRASPKWKDVNPYPRPSGTNARALMGPK